MCMSGDCFWPLGAGPFWPEPFSCFLGVSGVGCRPTASDASDMSDIKMVAFVAILIFFDDSFSSGRPLLRRLQLRQALCVNVQCARDKAMSELSDVGRVRHPTSDIS